MNNSTFRRVSQIIGQLDELTGELKELADSPSVKQRIKEIRIEMGFEQGGYLGHPTLDDLFPVPDEDEDEDEDE